MGRAVQLGKRLVGDGQPVYIVAEIGINHNGDIEIAKKLIDAACDAGCDAVKFQKRAGEKCVPPAQRNQMRETPWGYMTYLEYRYRIEFDEAGYREIDRYARQKGITWFASCWDEESVELIEQFNPPCHKIPSALLTNADLLRRVRTTGRPVILSTGMSRMDQIREAVNVLGAERLLIAHCTSAYPCKPGELNLRVIQCLRQEFDCPIGYSGHEVGLPPSVAAVALGACYVERHITLDRAMWGSDQAASIEPQGFRLLVKHIRTVEEALGDGIKKVHESELPVMRRLRRVDNLLRTGQQISGEPYAEADSGARGSSEVVVQQVSGLLHRATEALQ